MKPLPEPYTKKHGGPHPAKDLGDFTTTPRVIPIAMLAIGIGVIASYVALALLRMIGLFTNLFFYQRWSTEPVSPAGNHLGVWQIGVPVLGALIIGLMARYGSERIRGHGPVVARANPRRLVGQITLRDMLKARVRHLEEEQRRERVLPLSLIVFAWLRRARGIPASGRLPVESRNAEP
jgi:hypothetical protein